MDKKLNEIPFANVSNEELMKIKELETQLNNKYYLMAFDRT